MAPTSASARARNAGARASSVSSTRGIISPPSSAREDDFAERCVRRHSVMRFRGLLQREDLVDHGDELLLCDEWSDRVCEELRRGDLLLERTSAEHRSDEVKAPAENEREIDVRVDARRQPNEDQPSLLRERSKALG